MKVTYRATTGRWMAWRAQFLKEFKRVLEHPQELAASKDDADDFRTANAIATSKAGRHRPLYVHCSSLDPKSPQSTAALVQSRRETGPDYQEIRQTMDRLKLHTICEEARCPNVWECWNARTATFLILGDICTRRCHYCSVATGRPLPWIATSRCVWRSHPSPRT